jgi:ElaB/YqjD/DUF883 family membrane-anchored ribosome-binding protein
MTRSHPVNEPRSTAGTEELQEQIDQTRTELADTVEALAAKADVKTRLQDKAAQWRDQADVAGRRMADRTRVLARDRRAQAIGIGAGAAAVAAVLVRRGRA